MYQLSPNGLSLTKRFEGLRLQAYQDCAGVLTIGYGHTGSDVHPGLVITEAEADQRLLADMAKAVEIVNHFVHVPLTQGQIDALCDFVFNVGVHAFQNSTLLTCVNAGNHDAAAGQFLAWDHAGGKVVEGLLIRRKAEAARYRGQEC